MDTGCRAVTPYVRQASRPLQFLFQIPPNPTLPTRLRSRQGHSLLELVVVATMAGILLAGVIWKSRITPETLVRDEAEMMASALNEVKARAIASGQKSVFFFGSGGGLPGQGWYAPLWVPADSVVTAPPEAMKVYLTDPVIFGTGNATTGPMGDPVNASNPVPSGAITCDGWGRCTLGGSVLLTFYLQHEGAPNVLSAVTIGQSGGIRAWRYDPANQRWY